MRQEQEEQTTFRAELAAHAATARAALRSPIATERAAALEAATRDLAQLREREVARLRRELGQAEAAHTRAAEALSTESETVRRERADALLAECFAECENSIESLVKALRAEPSRKLTRQLQDTWAALCTRAESELGERLADHVLASTFVDSIIETVPGAIGVLSSPDYGCGERAVGALARFRRAASAIDAQAALEDFEAALLVAARRAKGNTADLVSTERAVLRRKHATHRDYTNALAELAERTSREANARFFEGYQPPPMNPPSLSARVAGWLGLDGE